MYDDEWIQSVRRQLVHKFYGVLRYASIAMSWQAGVELNYGVVEFGTSNGIGYVPFF